MIKNSYWISVKKELPAIQGPEVIWTNEDGIITHGWYDTLNGPTFFKSYGKCCYCLPSEEDEDFDEFNETSHSYCRDLGKKDKPTHWMLFSDFFKLTGMDQLPFQKRWRRELIKREKLEEKKEKLGIVDEDK